eukprot:6853380-Prymnesium_polylepis.4
MALSKVYPTARSAGRTTRRSTWTSKDCACAARRADRGARSNRNLDPWTPCVPQPTNVWRMGGYCGECRRT